MKESLIMIILALLLFSLACEKETNTEPKSDDQEPTDRSLVSHDGLLTVFNPTGQMVAEFSFPGYLFDVNQQTGDIWTTNPSDGQLYRLNSYGVILNTVPIGSANHPYVNQSTCECWLTGETETDCHFYCANSEGQIIRDFPNEAGYLHGVCCDEIQNQIWGAEAFTVSKFTMAGQKLFTIDGDFYQPTDMCVVQSDGSCWIGWIKTNPWSTFLAHYSQSGDELAHINSFSGALDVKQDDGSVICGDESRVHLLKYNSACNLVWSIPWEYGLILSIDTNQQNGNTWVLTNTDAVRVSPNGEVQRVISSFGATYCLRLYEPGQQG
jgi:hypothetical protein